MAQFRIKDFNKGNYMQADVNNKWISCTNNNKDTALIFTQNGTNETCNFQVPGTQLYLSFRDKTGAVKLYDAPDDASYKLELTSQGATSIYSITFKQYMWLSGKEPYITGSGSPKNTNALWIFEEVK